MIWKENHPDLTFVKANRGKGRKHFCFRYGKTSHKEGERSTGVG